MSDNSTSDAATGSGTATAQPRVADASEVLVVMPSGTNRRLLDDALSEQYDVTTTETAADLATDFDLCILDSSMYTRHAQRVQARKREAELSFLPVVLMVEEQSNLRSDPTVWETVDDVVSMPVPKVELRARIESLLDRRTESAQHQETLSELQLKNRVIDAAPIGITIAEHEAGNDPLVYANEAFEEITGYSEAEVLGDDCRFLQGKETDPAKIEEISSAMETAEPVSVDIVNYGRTGRKFWNQLDIAPVYDEDGAVEPTHFVGFQRDITDRKIREQRLQVLNRILRHNLRNDMSIISGYAQMVSESLDDPEVQSHLQMMKASADSLIQLGSLVNDAQKTLQNAENSATTADVSSLVECVLDDIETAFPEVPISLEVADGDLPAVSATVRRALSELVTSAAERGPEADGRIRITVKQSNRMPDGVEIRLIESGPGLPEIEREVMAAGEETQLNHADGLDLWLVKWIVQSTGGVFDIAENGDGETVLAMHLPGQEEQS